MVHNSGAFLGNYYEHNTKCSNSMHISIILVEFSIAIPYQYMKKPELISVPGCSDCLQAGFGPDLNPVGHLDEYYLKMNSWK